MVKFFKQDRVRPRPGAMPPPVGRGGQPGSWIVVVVAVLLAPGAAWGTEPGVVDLSRLPPVVPGQMEFGRDIQPLLKTHCLECHGPEKQKGGLRLDNRAAAMKGGDEGKVIVPGRSAESRLIHLVSGLEADAVMPPKGERLTAEQTGVLRAWIDQGAAWPDGGAVARVQSNHWSLQPLRAVVVPEGTADPVSAFISTRLSTEGVTLAPEADRATLIRRLSFDLTGLPPSPEEINAFASDPSPSAYPELVDRLLASPHYGERWGRHWLDVARFTESQGFEYDKLRPNAWHYRDYVINSFNGDKPYDQFMREQVAGDVLEPVTRDGMVAASLLVCGPWDEAGNSQANATQRAITREDELEDILGVVGQSFLGLTINCARCHAHKFDPIPHEDYYRLKSVFEGVKHGERSIAGSDETRHYHEQREELEKKLAAAAKVLAELEAAGSKGAVAAPGPVALARWKFDGTELGDMTGVVQGNAVIRDGRLQLPGEGAFFKTAPLPRDLSGKTLEAWVSLASLDQGGGAAISLQNQDGSVFDAIVFGERQPGQWTAGSNGFARTKEIGAPAEDSPPGSLIHLAIAYRADGSIAMFRNGKPYGQPYTPDAPLQTFRAGDAHVVLGLRHTGGGRPWLKGSVQQAALYDRALDEGEIAASFRAGGAGISLTEILARLSPAQRQAYQAAVGEVEQARAALAGVQPPTVVSYAGIRVQPAPTRRLIRGEVTSPDEVVTPGALAAVAGLDPDFGLAADAPEAQRRLKFAGWLTDPANPLPARVMVNRVWHYHFGQGLVSTPNDFGVGGALPSHPELLDWLAGQFIQSGWSVKALHRLMVHSAVYRQSAAFNARAAAVDAENQLLWRFAPRRLEAEAVRDAMLAVSGELNRQPGGPGFRPFEALPFPANAYAITDKSGPEFNRRTVYRMNVNSGKDPLLDAFDCPDPSVKTPRRGVTTTPLQALELMNNSFVQRQAQRLADRAVRTAGPGLEAAVHAAWQLSLGRSPTAEEARQATAAADARGLASVCWALLNSTEFVYVR